MHICFVCREYPPGHHGGIGSFTQTLGRALVARGHQVSVIGIYPRHRRGVEDDQGVRVIRLAGSPVPRTGFLFNGFHLRRALEDLHRESPIDILDGPELSFAMIPKSFPATKIIRMNGGHHFFAVTLGNRPRPWRSWLERRSFARADHLCAVSQFAAETTLNLLGLEKRNLEILPNPVNVSLFEPQPVEKEVDGLIMFVGTVCEKKGVRQLVEAMPQIIGAVPHARLWVVGRDGRDAATGESFTESLRALIPPALSDRVCFKGAVENNEVPGLLAQAQVCVYPSHMETQGIVIVEGMAMSKAVVTSQMGPGPEVVEDGISGLLCNPHDPASIANRVITLMKDADFRRKLGRQARVRAISQFSTEALVERNEAFYLRCLREQAAARAIELPQRLSSRSVSE